VGDEPDTGASQTIDDWRAGSGRHEVLIETPRHDAGLAALTSGEIAEALGACQARIAALHRQPGVRYVLIFKNHGQGSGASLRHPHFQIAGLPFVPERIESQLERARAHFERSGVCACCELIERERAEGSRLIRADDDLALFAPCAARFPGETWIMPRRHEARFEEASRHTLAATATALRNLVFALNAWVGEASYNLAIHTAPPQSDCAGSFHWRIELIPRLTGVAGFEWATGIHVNQVTPEEAAKSYRANWGSRSTAG
jgi:UDPglucose--hexose-1-phosphate uridylyltransferase